MNKSPHESRIEKITQQERLTLDFKANLADAQVYIPLNEIQLNAIACHNFLEEPRSANSLHDAKRTFLSEFTRFHNLTALPDERSVLFGYSASMGIEIAANALRICNRKKVALVHPTYDTSYHMLRRHDCALTAVDDRSFFYDPVQSLSNLSSINAVFVTAPNNPTGWDFSPQTFERLCNFCRGRDIVLILDCCFRAYSVEQIDHYEVINRSGVECIIVEDTGKLFDLKDIKLGFTSAFGNIAGLVKEVHRDFILDVPLFNLMVLNQVLHVSGPRHRADIAGVVAHNRKLAKDVLRTVGLTPIGGIASNVQLFRLPRGMNAKALREKALAEGVGIVDAAGYYWNEPASDLIRIALARTPSTFECHVSALAELVMLPGPVISR